MMVQSSTPSPPAKTVRADILANTTIAVTVTSVVIVTISSVIRLSDVELVVEGNTGDGDVPSSFCDRASSMKSLATRSPLMIVYAGLAIVERYLVDLSLATLVVDAEKRDKLISVGTCPSRKVYVMRRRWKQQLMVRSLEPVDEKTSRKAEL